VRLRRPAGRRRLRRQVLRVVRSLRPRLDMAGRRRCPRDARLALVLPRGRAGDLHAPERGTASRSGGGRLTRARVDASGRRRALPRRLGRLALRGRTADRPGEARCGFASVLVLTRWTAYSEAWREDVGCVGVETSDGLVFFDPSPARRAARLTSVRENVRAPRDVRTRRALPGLASG